MNPIVHGTQEMEKWRQGVVTRMRVSELTGSNAICIFEQWCEPGTGAPNHLHHVEEVLSVVHGKAEIRLGDRYVTLTENQSVVVPPGMEHGFRNAGDGELHMLAMLACCYFEAIQIPTGQAVVRWRSTNPL